MAATVARPTLRLQPGETLLLEGTPVPALNPAQSWGTAIVLTLMIVTLPLVPLVPLIVRQTLGWHRWWLTDRRLVVRRGFIGWSMRSVPLDRIVDVTTKASWWDRLWGVEHITVRDMTGEVGSNGVSSGLSLLGVADAQAVGERILAETPQAAIERGADMGQVVALLQQLVDRTPAVVPAGR